jgi:hypothetical protein
MNAALSQVEGDKDARALELESIVATARGLLRSLRRDDREGALSALDRLEHRVENYVRGRRHHERQVRVARRVLELSKEATRSNGSIGKAERALASLGLLA